MFPGIFRGVFDIRARTVTDNMAVAAAQELAAYAQRRGINEDDIVPRMDEWEVFPRVAVATAMKAQEEGVARLTKDETSLFEEAKQIILSARESTAILMREGIIAPVPET